MDIFCRPPCTPNTAQPIPGVAAVFDLSTDGSTDDSSLAEIDVTTSNVVGTWVELMPADQDRGGAVIQAKYATGNVFIKQQDTGLPTSGAKPGETQLSAAPASYTFVFEPLRRYVMRGDTASLTVSLKTW